MPRGSVLMEMFQLALAAKMVTIGDGWVESPDSEKNLQGHLTSNRLNNSDSLNVMIDPLSNHLNTL